MLHNDAVNGNNKMLHDDAVNGNNKMLHDDAINGNNKMLHECHQNRGKKTRRLGGGMRKCRKVYGRRDGICRE